MKNLLFRRQFLLTNKPVEVDGNWNHRHIDIDKRNLHLYSHPDLNTNFVQVQERLIVLFGFILDPFHPELSNEDILDRIIKVSNLSNLFNEVENFCGRFAILYCNEEGTYMFHDATGFREVYYSFTENQMLCGSTPNIINQYAQMELDKEKSIIEFINSREYRTSGFWIGNRTPFKNIYHLLPNSYLDLNSKTCHRYWPDKKRIEINIEDGVALMAKILKGIMLSAENRYTLHQGLTGGYETRMLLAASKDVKDHIKFLVNRIENTTDVTADIEIPKQLADRFNLNFEIVNIEQLIVEDNFKDIFYKNNVFARDIHLNVFYDAYTKGYDNTYWVTGTSGNEILRNVFPLKKRKISSIDLAKKFNYGNYAFVIDSIEKWLINSSEVINKYGYNIVNMFYWEHLTGNMQNLGGSEGDIVREEFRPLNCRKFISTYISLNDKYRHKEYPIGHLKIIEYLWKELLDVPIGMYKNSPNFWIRKTLRSLGMEILADNLYNIYKSMVIYRGK